MTIFESTRGSLLTFISGDAGLGNVGEKQYNEYYGKNTQSNKQCRSGIADLCLTDVTDHSTYQDGYSRCSQRVADTTELNELVTLVATAAQRVEHRVNNAVKHTHAETGNESTHQVNRETLNTFPT